MVTNMERSLKFYVKGLGFELKLEWKPEGTIEWCWLEREGVALMLQEYKKEHVPLQKLGLGISICFMCRDALELYDEFLNAGLTPAEPFVGNNLWVVQLKDPDGFDIAFESPTDVPEETKYSEWRQMK